ncbi:MAG TPA: TIR domain-containing protein [Solirubrobacteraceae bacterium]|nr:TIR domain-containing protein [Solirubrobacteraceae bacterium]
MVPPILDVFVVWHPEDAAGELVAAQFLEHFHGSAFSGLIGGAIEVYVRSQGWRDARDAPRPLSPGAYEINGAGMTAIVPVLGVGFADAVESGEGPWLEYARQVAELRHADPNSVGVFPVRLSEGATNGTKLGELFGSIQSIGPQAGAPTAETAAARCRDLAQGIAQLANGQSRLKVFISHTKRGAAGEVEQLARLITQVRSAIDGTRLAEYFDASDLQPGADWIADLDANARASALLAVRTDLYASREWCQREVASAKLAGMPVVILDALSDGEERGSFLMDHVARVPAASARDELNDAAIVVALNRLVDESLKRELWERQRQVTAGGAEWSIAWWAPHAPEPLTLASWLTDEIAELPRDADVRVLHPDPPLGPVERDALEQIADLTGLAKRLDVMTPRGLAARGG